MAAVTLTGKGSSSFAGRAALRVPHAGQITVVAWHLETNGTLTELGAVTTATKPQWTEIIGEPGSGSVTIQNDDSILDDLGFDGWDLIQFLIDGVPVWVMVPDPAEIVTVSSDEEAGETTTLSGPGLLGLLDRMRVYPTGGPDRLPKETDRFFNWTSLDFDDSAWDDAKDILLVGYAKQTWPEPWAEDFPLDIALIIWADNPLGNASDYLSADEGRCWFRYPFTVATEGIYRAFLTADNDAKLYIDGQLVGQSESFTTTTQIDFSLSAGSHVLAIDAHNGAWLPGLDAGPGGVALAIYYVTLIGLFLVTYSFDGYQVLAYQDDPPGVTPGYAFGLFLTEGQTRGVLPGLTWDFDDTDDSDSNAWAAVADVSTSVGNGGLAFVRELCGTYMDVEFSPDFTNDGLLLHAYILGEMGTASGKTLAKGTNLTGLNHRRESLPWTTLLVEAAERWVERTDLSAETAYGRSESRLDAGSPATIAEVNRIADGQLDIYAHPREEITAGVHDDDECVPYVDFRVGDTVTVPDSTGASDAERCVSISVSQDDSTDRAVFTVSFRDVVLGSQERLVRMVVK